MFFQACSISPGTGKIFRALLALTAEAMYDERRRHCKASYKSTQSTSERMQKEEQFGDLNTKRENIVMLNHKTCSRPSITLVALFSIISGFTQCFLTCVTGTEIRVC